mgnify:CR=1 FL=1
MKDSVKSSFSILKHIHYFFYYTGILTLPLLPIYPAIMLSLGIFGKITILKSNNIIPLKRIICVTLYAYYNNYSITNIYVNLLLAPIFLSIYTHFFGMVKTNTIYNV